MNLLGYIPLIYYFSHWEEFFIAQIQYFFLLKQHVDRDATLIVKPFFIYDNLSNNISMARKVETLHACLIFGQTGRTAAIMRRIAVRGSSASCHCGSPFEGSLNPLGPSQHYRIEGYKVTLDWVPIMLRDATLKNIPN